MSVSVLGLGTVKLGRTRGLKYAAQPGALPSDEQAGELFAAAAELGINLIDTAPAYGVSEERIGELMRRNAWFGGRERWIVCTKAGEEFDDATGESRFDFSPAAVRGSVERSLRRLGVDRLELLLLHSDGRDEWIINESGALRTLEDLKREGVVRAIGVSTKTVEGGILAAGCCDVVMVTHNPAYTAEQRVIDAAMDAGAGVVVKKGLESGRAADPAVAIRFVLGTPGVSAMVVGTSNPQHLRANAAALEEAV